MPMSQLLIPEHSLWTPHAWQTKECAITKMPKLTDTWLLGLCFLVHVIKSQLGWLKRVHLSSAHNADNSYASRLRKWDCSTHKGNGFFTHMLFRQLPSHFSQGSSILHSKTTEKRLSNVSGWETLNIKLSGPSRTGPRLKFSIKGHDRVLAYTYNARVQRLHEFLMYAIPHP